MSSADAAAAAGDGLRRRRAPSPSSSSGAVDDAADAGVEARRPNGFTPPGPPPPSPGAAPRAPISARRAFWTLMVARVASAVLNLVHDCDETYNFWEPLHYLVHGRGMQTWEHAPRFALRSYAYLASHALVAAPASWLFAPDASGRRRVLAFHAVRVALGAASARAEARLVSETSRLSPLAGGAALLLLLWSAGMFVASTSFLPSQFAMVCLTHAAAHVLAGEHRAACAACVLAVVLGWPFAGVAAIPYGLASLRAVGFARTLFAVSISLLLSSLASFAIDRHFYGRDTWSVANIVRYNVLADTGGNSQLYGVESPTFYLRNLANAFNVALLASLAAPFAAMSASTFRETPPARRAAYAKLLLAYSPFPLALAFFSALAHKEERFMYVAYPHLALGAAIACAALVDVAGAAARAGVAPRRAALVASAIALLLIVAHAGLSASRVAALLDGYGAPIRAFRGLPESSESESSFRGQRSSADESARRSRLVCVASEWHRFPSSFHLPGSDYRIAFLKQPAPWGFDGALPVPFDPASGGTRGDPPGLNDRNAASDEQWTELDRCAFVVDAKGLGGVRSAIDPRDVERSIDRSKGHPIEGGSASRWNPERGKPNRERTRAPKAYASWDDDGGGGDGGEDASLAADGFGFDAEDGFVDGPPGDGRARWVAVGEYAFLDASRSPALSRAFFVPGWSRERNTYGAVVVYERVADGEGEPESEPFEEEGDGSSEVDAASGRARGGDEVEEL